MMTQPNPQQEYIITEDMLRWWRNQCIAVPSHIDPDPCKRCKYLGKGSRRGCCEFDDNAMEQIFRSRPHTPAAPAERHLIYTVGECMTQCQKARDDEREQVLDVLEEFLNSDDHLSLFKWEVREQIRSLRGGTP